MTAKILFVSRLLAESEDKRPTRRSGPAFLMKKLVQPNIFVMFSKDVLTFTEGWRTYLHLSVSHPKGTGFAPDHNWVAREFVTILGKPFRTSDAHFSWIREDSTDRRPGEIHHYFWAA